MNKKLVKEFIIIIFAINVVCALITTIFHLKSVRIISIIASFSPSIASYISLKRNVEVGSFREWLREIFDVKHNISIYVMILFILIYCIIGCSILEFYMIFITPILLMQFLNSANKEAGLRMVLQKELEKSFNFHVATILTAIAEWIWYAPTFFTKGTVHMSYFLFGIMCLTLSYALATIRKVTNSIFPCILTHWAINILLMILAYKWGFLNCIISLIVTIIASTIILNANQKLQMADN